MGGGGWGTLATIALMVLVIFTIPPVKDKIYASTENFAKVVGLDIGKPRIGSFTATPIDANNDNKFEMKFDVSIAGNKKDVVFEIYESKAGDDLTATELKAPDPKFGPEDRIYTSEDTADKLVELAKSGVFSIVCPIGTNNEGCNSKNLKKPRSEFKPDWYRFSAVLKKKGKTVYQSDALVGFYNEDYVELLDKPIQGCDFPGMNNCNVTECKKTIMNEAADLFGVHQTARPELGKIAKEVTSDTCVTYDPTKTPVLEFSCSKGQVDELNKKFARTRMFRDANELTGLTLENDYNKFADKVGDFKQFGITNSLVCSNGEGQFQGAYGHLNSVGWVPVGGFNEWKNKVKVEIEGFLAGLKPGISSIRADAFDDRHLGLSWGVPVGENMVKAGSYKISHFYKRWERSVTPENQKVLQSETAVAGQKGDGSVLTSFNTAAGQQTGKHEFEVRIFEKPDALGSELFLAKAATGLFDDAYIETYKGGVDGECVTKGVKDPDILKECDVDAQKREELATLDNQGEKRRKVLAALGKAGVGNDCKYQKSGPTPFHKFWLSKECTPEEVDGVWKNYLAEIGRADDYGCVLPLSSEANSVCIVKRQTVATLQTRGWKDVRADKGWENNV